MDNGISGSYTEDLHIHVMWRPWVRAARGGSAKQSAVFTVTTSSCISNHNESVWNALPADTRPQGGIWARHDQ